MNAFIVVFALAVATANAGFISTIHGYATPGLVSSPYAVPLSYAAVVPAGHGLEGQYIPDNTEKLYDDGSYRPEARAIPLSPSPYGLVPFGSGLEGEYVHDNLDKLHDDGSYRPELQALSLSATPYGVLTPSGSGLEGGYVHDHSEKLYDDGSYRPGYYH
ncbi:unnamed protein product [Psylliodes chrysocephalus]|uniref:Uncharacterized protein n=1 Tax=Psylliodes chrysocephalus TaxID=3402493 RepID=A0A9P0G4I3_9CUCU|nr:unnamed protein product [Psylliodes chrysocephala]